MMLPANRMVICVVVVLGCFMAWMGLAAPGASGVAAAVEPNAEKVDWPQWRGERRDGQSRETGLLSTWPEKGPHLAWQFSDLGRGYSSPIVVGDSLYITGDRAEGLEIVALDLKGNLRWRTKNGKCWKNPWPGARAACCYDEGRLYNMNAHGRLACLSAETGKDVWAVNVLEEFAAKNVTWGRSEGVLIEGDKVFVTAAGEKALMAALDKKTGRTVWASPPLPGEKTAYASPILISRGSRRILVNLGSHHSFGVDAATGRLLWKHRHPVELNVLGSTPLWVEDSVLITNSSRDASALYRLRLGTDGADVAPVWSSVVKNGQAGLIRAAGQIYGANGRDGGDGLAVVELATGKAGQIPGGLAFGSAAHVDGRIYYLTQLGEMALLKPTRGGADIVGRFRLVEQPKKKDVWAHPVVCRGKLFLRYHETLYCYDVSRS